MQLDYSVTNRLFYDKRIVAILKEDKGSIVGLLKD